MLEATLLSMIASFLALAMIQREMIARRQEASLKAHTNAMEDLRLTLSMCIDEVRSVQTYGLRIQK
jgi:preprotein translocase subunit YajC